MRFFRENFGMAMVSLTGAISLKKCCGPFNKSREMDEKPATNRKTLCHCQCQMTTKDKEKPVKEIKPESISEIRITCSQRCSNWFRILTFMMINGEGSQFQSLAQNRFILDGTRIALSE